MISPLTRAACPAVTTAKLDGRYDDHFAELTSAGLELFCFAQELYAQRFAPTLELVDIDRRNPGRRYLCVRADAVNVSEVGFSG